jgi:Ca2+-binding EF-hand superfamily protein
METVFERFDKFKKGYLVPDDLSEFMLDNKIYPTDVELYLIFRELDKERAGVVTLQQLAMELLPK